LHEAALEAGCKLRLGQKVVSIKEDLPVVQLQDGTTVHGDIVVIADGKYACHGFSKITTTKLTVPGIKSALRQLISPEEDTSALSQPLSKYRAWAPMDALNTNEQVAKLLSQPATNVWLGPDRHMIVYPAEGGNILAINGTYASRNDRAGKVVLIGDAAHGMLQFLAQGAAMATEDAGALAECIKDLRSGGDIPRAMYYYERSRKWRGERVQSQARRNGEFIHMPDGEEQEHRDRKLAGNPLPSDQDVDCGPLLDPKSTSWLYGHDTIERTRHILGKA
jgi:salicylate hydroxylase